MAFFDMYPNSQMHELNLDWIIARIKELTQQYMENVGKIEDLEKDFKALKKYVEDFFEDLNVKEKVDEKLEEMLADGTLAELIHNFIARPVKLISTGRVDGFDQYHRTYDWNTMITPSGKVVMVDVGRPSTFYQETLEANGITKLNMIILSHYHYDHTGNLANLLEYLDVSDCIAYLPVRPLERAGEGTQAEHDGIIALLNQYNIPFVYPNEANDTAEIDNLKIKFYNYNFFADYYGVEEGFNYNNCCLCCRVEYNGSSVFFSGDIQPLAMEKLATVLPHADIVKMAHHTYNQIIDETYECALSPSWYFATNGNDEANSNVDDPTHAELINNKSDEPRYAHRHAIPVYATSEAPNRTLIIEFGNGAFNTNTNKLPNITVGDFDYNTFYDVYKGAGFRHDSTLIDIMDKLPNNKSMRVVMPGSYKSNGVGNAVIMEGHKISGGASSMSNIPRIYGQLIESTSANRNQILEFQRINLDEPYNVIQNGSFGNYAAFSGSLQIPCSLSIRSESSNQLKVGNNDFTIVDGIIKVNTDCAALISVTYSQPGGGSHGTMPTYCDSIVTRPSTGRSYSYRTMMSGQDRKEDFTYTKVFTFVSGDTFSIVPSVQNTNVKVDVTMIILSYLWGYDSSVLLRKNPRPDLQSINDIE